MNFGAYNFKCSVHFVIGERGREVTTNYSIPGFLQELVFTSFGTTLSPIEIVEEVRGESWVGCTKKRIILIKQRNVYIEIVNCSYCHSPEDKCILFYLIELYLLCHKGQKKVSAPVLLEIPKPKVHNYNEMLMFSIV